MGKGKIEKYGSYVCKVGYLDVRQRIVMPRFKKGNKVDAQSIPGSVDVFVYHSKNKVSGPFKSHKLAIESATELVGKNYKFKK
jgi:hypothetical protein|tara:strand:+ start:2071 stop:2319 length:249 start_codon:yes stop_codon:yes gene_type:complete